MTSRSRPVHVDILDAAIVPKSKKLLSYGGLDPIRAVATLVDCFEDPAKPKYCAQCFQACVVVLAHYTLGWPGNVPVLRYHFPDVYDRCIRFLLFPRTELEMDALASSVFECHCDLSDDFLRDLHDMPTGIMVDADGKNIKRDEENIRDAFLLVISLVHNGIQPAMEAGNLYKADAHAEKAARKGVVLPWPESIHSLIPYGARESILALGAVIQKTPLPLSAGFLGSIMDCVREPTIRPFLESPTLSGDVIGIANIQLISWTMLTTPGMRSGRSPEGNVCCKIITEMKNVCLVLRVLISLCDDDELIRFNRQAKEQMGQGNILEMCNHALGYLPQAYAKIRRPVPGITTDFHYCVEILSIMGGRLHFALGHQGSKWNQLILDRSRNLLIGRIDMGLQGYEAIFAFSHSYLCWAPGCPNTFTSAERKFSKCARCERVAYCSKECQLRGWKDPVSPHKAICPKIAHVVKALQITAKPTQRARDDFSLHCLERGVDLVDMVEICRHYRYLRGTHSARAPEDADITLAEDGHDDQEKQSADFTAETCM